MKITWENLLEYLTPKLNEDNFVKQIVEHGYFAEQFPSCFNSNEIAKHIDELIALTPCSKAQSKKVVQIPLSLLHIPRRKMKSQEE